MIDEDEQNCKSSFFCFFLDAEELFLVIHNIDGSMLRAKKVSLHSV